MSDLNFVQLGEKLSTLRKGVNLTRHAMAKLSGYHVNTIKIYENGDCAPSLGYLIALAKIVNTPLSPLVHELTVSMGGAGLSDNQDANAISSVKESAEMTISLSRAEALKLIQELAKHLISTEQDIIKLSIPTY